LRACTIKQLSLQSSYHAHIIYFVAKIKLRPV
jgi:hypothetical protein